MDYAFRPVQLLRVCLLMCLVLVGGSISQVVAAIHFGDPNGPLVESTCGPTQPDMDVELDAGFVLHVQNCTATPGVGSLLTLVYSTPGGNQNDIEQFGSEDKRIDFSSVGQKISIPIEETDTTGNGTHVIDVLVSSFSLAGGGNGSIPVGEPVQVQRFEDPTFTNFVPLYQVREMLGRQLRSMDVTMPQNMETLCDINGQNCQGPAEGCGPLTDAKDVVAENLGNFTIISGRLDAKSICAADVTDPTPCISSSPTRIGLQGTNYLLDPNNFGPEGCVLGSSSPDDKYANCCDPQPLDDQILLPLSERAIVTVQCSHISVTEIEVNGVRKTIAPAFFSEWSRDVHPSRIAGAAETGVAYNKDDVTIQCDAFNLLPSTPSLQRTAANCTGNSPRDRDRDGIIDACDYLIAPFDAGSGETTGILQRHFRVLDYTDKSGGTGLDDFTSAEVKEVRIDGVVVPADLAGTSSLTLLDLNSPETDALVFSIPDTFADGNSHTITVNPKSGPIETAREALVIPKTAFIPISGENYLDTFVEPSLDAAPVGSAFANSLIDLPAGALPASAAPTTAAFSREAGNVNKELVITSGTDVFLANLGSGTLVDLGGGITSRAVGTDVRKLVLEEDGQFGFVFHDTGEIGAIQVQRYKAFDPNRPVQAANRLATFPSVTSVMGRGADISVRKLTNDPGTNNPRFAIYATWSCINCIPEEPTLPSCGLLTSARLDQDQPVLMAQATPIPAMNTTEQFNGQFHAIGGPFATSLLWSSLMRECNIYSNCSFELLPGEGGGSGTAVSRNVWLSVRVLQANMLGDTFLNPNDPWIEECHPDTLLWTELVGGGSPVWEHIGMAFSTDTSQTRLYVVSPDSDQLLTFNTVTGSESYQRIFVGKHPFDVAAIDAKFPSSPDEERVYVANHGHAGVANDDTVTIINPANPTTAITPVLLNDFFPSWEHLSIERITSADFSNLLFLVSGDNQRVFAIGVDINGDEPRNAGSLPVGGSPGKVAVQVVAP